MQSQLNSPHCHVKQHFVVKLGGTLSWAVYTSGCLHTTEQFSGVLGFVMGDIYSQKTANGMFHHFFKNPMISQSFWLSKSHKMSHPDLEKVNCMCLQ